MARAPTTTISTRIDRTAWHTLAIGSAVSFMVSIELTIISLAFPQIRAAFPDTAEATLAWVFTAYNIGVASLLLVAGWAADRYGRKRVFLLGLAVFGVGSLVAGASQSAEMLIAARVFQAVGGSMQFPAGLALLLVAFPPARRQMAIGIWGAMGGLAAAVGPSLGAVLVNASNWRAVFLINVPVALVALVMGRRLLVESRSDNVAEHVDKISVPLASIGVGALVLGIVQSDTWGWVDPRTIASYLVGAVLLIVFVMRSRRHPDPLFDLDLFRLRSFTVGNIGTFFFSVAFFIWLVLLPTFIQEVWGWSVLRTGFAIAPAPLISMLISPPLGRLADRIGNRLILTAGGAFGAIGMCLHLVLTDTTPDYLTGILLPGIFIGLAAGSSFAMLVGATMRDVPPDRYGMGGAGRTTVFQLSVAVGIALGIAIVGRPVSAEAALDAIQTTWLVALGAYLMQMLVFAVAFPRHQARPLR